MSAPSPTTEMIPLQVSWVWYVTLGAIFLLLGIIGLSMAYALTLYSVLVAGILLVLGGVSQIVSGCFTRPFSNGLLQLVGGILYLVAGVFVVTEPELATVIYTLIIAISLIINGATRIILAFLHRRFLSWLAIVLGGFITMVVGIYILNRWPWSSAWVIGLFFAIDLMTQGIVWMAHGIQMRRGAVAASI